MCNNDISHITRLGWLANWVLLTADLNSNNVVWSLLRKWKDLCSPLRNESIFRNTDVWVWNQAWNVSLFSGQYSWPPSRCKVGPEGKWFPHALGLRWIIVCLFMALGWPCGLVHRFYLKCVWGRSVLARLMFVYGNCVSVRKRRKLIVFFIVIYDMKFWMPNIMKFWMHDTNSNNIYLLVFQLRMLRGVCCWEYIQTASLFATP